MPASSIQRALISVYDKTGLVDFARALHDELGIEIFSTGGTAKALGAAGIPATLVETVTGFGEMLDGRVKTLHPRIHAAILADRDDAGHMAQLAAAGIQPIDMVVVNLYPFEQTIARPECGLAEAIEMIDIGGPCLLRAAAKNHAHVLVVADPRRYDEVLRQLRENRGERPPATVYREGAVTALSATCTYDAAIARWLSHDAESGASAFEAIPLNRAGALRYGENPHQAAAFFHRRDVPAAIDLATAGVGSCAVEMSYNNYVDADAALQLCDELRAAALSQHACVFVKHTNACGVGVSDESSEAAFRSAYLGDPNASMGGILACGFPVQCDFARSVMYALDQWGKDAGAGAFFVEVWIAAKFDDDAVELIQTAKAWGKRVRLLAVGDTALSENIGGRSVRDVAGGILMQTRDHSGLDEDRWKVVTKRQPTEAEWRDLRLAWLVCKHTKSNAITICRDGQLLGNGAGQMSRVMSCRIATWLATENGHAEALQGAVAASDAFFPFPDGPEILAEAGISAIIQPGGSKRDAEVIKAADQHPIAMVMTGTRHFKH